MVDDIKKKKQILARAKSLREVDKWKNMYISPDLTIKEREEGKILRDKLRQLRSEGQDHYIIKRGKIVKVSEDPTHTTKTTTDTSLAMNAESVNQISTPERK